MTALHHTIWLALAILLTGCGYQPLYGTRDQGAPVETQLSAVSVELQTSRLGQLVRNELVSSMATGGAGSYQLKLDVNDSTSTVISYPKPRISRKAVEVTVGYSLFGPDRRKPLTKGTVKSKVSYDITDQPFADRQADADATARAAGEAAGEIRTRLAVYFSRQ